MVVVGARVYWTTLERGGRLVLLASETGSGRELWHRTVTLPEGPLQDPIP